MVLIIAAGELVCCCDRQSRCPGAADELGLLREDEWPLILMMLVCHGVDALA